MTDSVKAILFDAVGTLIRPASPIAAIYREAGLRSGVDIDLHEIERRFKEAMAREDERDRMELAFRTSEQRERMRWRTIVEHVFAESPRWAEVFAELWDVFGRAQTWPLFDDVAPTLRNLKGRGYLLGVASNFDGRLARVMAGHAELGFMDRCFVSSEIGYRKPSLRFFEAVAAELGLPPEAILLVGDDYENDFVAARRCGWQALFLDRSGQSLADATVGGLEQLL